MVGSAIVCMVASLLIQFTQTSAAAIHVNSETGKNSSLCLQTVPEVACKSFRYAATGLRGTSSWEIIVETDIQLSGIIQFENIANITITGSLSSASPKRAVCSNESMLYFSKVNNITIKNINFSHCGALDKATHYKPAVYFKESSNITIENTILYKSCSTGMAFLACSGSILLQDVAIVKSGCEKQSSRCFSFPAGLSFMISLSNTPAYCTLHNCSVILNVGASVNGSCSDDSVHQFYSKGHGGGIGVFFVNGTSGNSFNITNTTISSNHGRWGGGLYVNFENSTHDNSVLVSSTTFQNNSASSSGGGANVVYSSSSNLKTKINQVVFSHIVLFDNYATYGGGLAIASTYSARNYTAGSSMVFDSCTLKKNRGIYSPAVDVSIYFYEQSSQNGFLPIPLFSNMDIINNFITPAQRYLANDTIKITSGVFSVAKCTIHFKGKVNFFKNQFSALLLSSANVFIESGTKVVFANNSNGDYNGGAIAMYGYSVVFVERKTHLEFLENRAGLYGGGVYYKTSDQHTFITGTSCFMQYAGPKSVPVEDRNITIIFRGNQAKGGASSVYADSFYSCLYNCPEYREKVDGTIMQCIGKVTLDEGPSVKTSLQSSGYKFTFSTNFTFNISVFPGAKIAVPFFVIDEFNNTVHPLLNVVSVKGSRIMFFPEYTFTGEVTPYGYPHDAAIVHFITQGIGSIYFHFNLTLLECPPGFYFNNDTKRPACECSADIDLFQAISHCKTDSFGAYMKRDHWAGYIHPNSTNLYFSSCFEPFCNSSDSSHILLPNSSDKLDSVVCFKNRTGVLCGTCKDGNSVYYHSRSFLCRWNHMCRWGPVFYLLSEILPVCVLFAIVILFDFSFTSGNIVGFIFYCQYLERLTVYTNTTVIQYLRKPYRIFYGIFNFEFFSLDSLSFCLGEDFQILDIIAVRYITIVTAFALVVGLVAFLKSNRCSLLLRWRTRITTKTSFIRGMSAFLVMCYSQCTVNGFLILKFADPVGEYGIKGDRYTYYGGLPYLEGRHLVYAIIAILTLIFITILPPLLLLVYPLSLHLLSLCNVSEHWLVNRIMRSTTVVRLLPFMDCFQSCYKDELRFFAGLYFVYRVVILCFYTLFETYCSYRMSAQIALSLFLGIHAITKPYKNHFHNLIDSLIFLNLTLINAIAIYSDYLLDEITENDQNGKTPLIILTVVQLVLLYLPMLVAVKYAAVKFWTFCKGIRCARRDYEMIDAKDH